MTLGPLTPSCEQVLQEDVDVGYVETAIGVLSVDARGNNDYASSPTRVKFPSTGKLLLGKSERFSIWHPGTTKDCNQESGIARSVF